MSIFDNFDEKFANFTKKVNSAAEQFDKKVTENWKMDESPNGVAEEMQRNSQQGDEDILFEKKDIQFFCNNCGAKILTNNLTKFVKCEFCDAKLINPNYFDINANNSTNIQKYIYPIAIGFNNEEGGFDAFDVTLQVFSDIHDSVIDVAKDMKKQIQDILQEQLDCGEEIEIPSEESLLKNKEVQNVIQKEGYKIKFLLLSLKKPTEPENDPNW